MLSGYSGQRSGEHAAEYKRLLGIHEFENLQYKKMSLGMQKRLALYAGLLYPKKIYILDEPANGLDAAGTRSLVEIINQLRLQASVIISSHHHSALEMLCSRFLFLDKGLMVLQLSAREVQERYGSVREAYQAVFCSQQ